MKKQAILSLTIVAVDLMATGCTPPAFAPDRVIPAEEYSNAIKAGNVSNFSIFKIAEEPSRALQTGQQDEHVPDSLRAKLTLASARGAADPAAYARPALAMQGDSGEAVTTFVKDGEAVGSNTDAYSQPSPRPPQLPPGSSAPYLARQMTANPSLWPDEGQGASMFNDFRAFQTMDVITVLVNESSDASKKTKTNTESKFNLLAGIKSLFGIETKNWASNNLGLDPASLINAETNSKYDAKGETNRSGNLKAQISALILELLPNGLMRIEGTKIVSVDNEEEVMVISGLVRSRDINSSNQVDSSRVANMRVDFYGRGVVGDKTSAGWGARLFDHVWPF